MERANKYLSFYEPVSETVTQFFCCESNQNEQLKSINMFQ